MQNLKNITFYPGFKTGTVSSPCSKSIAHRALICAALAGGSLDLSDRSEDIEATLAALEVIKKCGSYINCKESGSTLRFLIPVVAALGIEASFSGEGSLRSRTIGLYHEIFEGKGVKFESESGKLPASVKGKLTPGTFFMPGDITSQYITGLMLALPILGGDSDIILTSPLESEPYVNMTIDVVKSFGVNIKKEAKGYHIAGNQSYKNTDFTVEGDYSQAAFFMCAGAINGDITIKRLKPDSMQGDARIIDILNEFGAKVFFEGENLRAKKGENLKGIKIDASQIPDLAPVLSVVAAYAEGETVIYNASRLRLKESDRIKSTCDLLKAIGAKAEETSDGIKIIGSGLKTLPGGFVNSFGDHRIAMSAAVASLYTDNGVTVDDMSCMNKSYPMFLRDWEGLI